MFFCWFLVFFEFFMKSVPHSFAYAAYFGKGFNFKTCTVLFEEIRLLARACASAVLHEIVLHKWEIFPSWKFSQAWLFSMLGLNSPRMKFFSRVLKLSQITLWIWVKDGKHFEALFQRHHLKKGLPLYLTMPKQVFRPKSCNVLEGKLHNFMSITRVWSNGISEELQNSRVMRGPAVWEAMMGCQLRFWGNSQGRHIKLGFE